MFSRAAIVWTTAQLELLQLELDERLKYIYL